MKKAENSKKAKANVSKQEVRKMKNISTVAASDTTVSTVAVASDTTVSTVAVASDTTVSTAAAASDTTVSTAAAEKAEKEAEKAAKKAAKEAEKAAKKAAKEAAEAEKRARWIKNAMLEDGKYLAVVEKDYANYDQHPGWNPCYYIVTTSFDMTRIGLKFAVELLEQGKAVEVTKDQVRELKAKTKAAKKAEAAATDSSKAA